MSPYTTGCFCLTERLQLSPRIITYHHCWQPCHNLSQVTTSILKQKISRVESIAESIAKQLTYPGFVYLGLARIEKQRSTCISVLACELANKPYGSTQPSMSLYCHVLYAFHTVQSSVNNRLPCQQCKSMCSGELVVFFSHELSLTVSSC